MPWPNELKPERSGVFITLACIVGFILLVLAHEAFAEEISPHAYAPPIGDHTDTCTKPMWISVNALGWTVNTVYEDPSCAVQPEGYKVAVMHAYHRNNEMTPQARRAILNEYCNAGDEGVYDTDCVNNVDAFIEEVESTRSLLLTSLKRKSQPAAEGNPFWWLAGLLAVLWAAFMGLNYLKHRWHIQSMGDFYNEFRNRHKED